MIETIYIIACTVLGLFTGMVLILFILDCRHYSKKYEENLEKYTLWKRKFLKLKGA